MISAFDIVPDIVHEILGGRRLAIDFQSKREQPLKILIAFFAVGNHSQKALKNYLEGTLPLFDCDDVACHGFSIFYGRRRCANISTITMISTDANDDPAFEWAQGIPGRSARFSIDIRRRWWPLLLAWIILPAAFWGCATRKGPALDHPGAIPGQPDALAVYRAMVAENIGLINRLYQPRYENAAFIVDTDTGSAPVQALINTEAAAAYLRRHELPDGPATADAMLSLVQSRFAFVDEPQPWQSVAETIASGRGDCKNLSLLLLSMLAVAGVPAYAGVSNGHMWVVATAPETARIMELDTSPIRGTVYAIAMFYDVPLYRIYTTHTEKRRRREQSSPQRPGDDGALAGEAPVGRAPGHRAGP